MDSQAGGSRNWVTAKVVARATRSSPCKLLCGISHEGGAALVAASSALQTRGTVGAKPRDGDAAPAGAVATCTESGWGKAGTRSMASVDASAGCLLRHHCCDICSSMASIFCMVTARASAEVRLLWKTDGRLAASAGAPAPSADDAWRSRRSWSNSRWRTKSLRRLRSSICRKACLSGAADRSSASASSSDQLTVG
ncbi:hypothetical protein D3C78_1130310 [compost metagenome]